MADNEEWSREFVLDTIRDAIRGALDSEYDDEAEVFFDVKFGDESLVITVTDATDDSLSEEVIVSFN